MTGAVLSEDVDPELQALSLQASQDLRTPMAAVALVLERVTFLRGYHGLSPALEAARATDREISFCELTVRDSTLFEVTDAANDARVPQEMVERYGIASYLGAPIILGNQAVGALCVVDTRPRTFADAERAQLTVLAKAASARLGMLAMQPRERERVLRDRAVRPVFGEIRNRLQPLVSSTTMMQAALTELAAVQRLARHVAETGSVAELSLLTRGDAALADLRTCLADLEEAADDVRRSVVAVERATLVTPSGCSLAEVLDAAAILAYHRTKLVSGVRWSGDRSVSLRASRPVVVTALSAALTCIADELYATGECTGVDGEVRIEGSVVVIRLRADLGPYGMTSIAEQLQLLVGDSSEIAIGVDGGVLELELVRRVAQPTAALLARSSV